MEDLTSLKTGGKNNLYMIGILIVIGLVLFLYLPNVISFGKNRPEIVAVYSGKLIKGGNVTLTLELKNDLSKPVTIKKLVMILYADDVITINPNEVDVGTIGPDEFRRIKFEINATDSALEGKYIIEVKSDYETETVTDILNLFVES